MPVSDIAPAPGRLLVSLGLVQGYTVYQRRLRAVSPSLNSRGLTGRLNDTVGVTACLRLIFRMWLKFAVGSFSSALSRQKGPFQRYLCMFVCAQFVCLHMYSSEEMHKRKMVLWLLSRLCWNLTFPEMMSFVWACLQCVLHLFIACHICTHTAYLQGDTEEWRLHK